MSADKLGTQTGGGQVVYHEHKFLSETGKTAYITINHLQPWGSPFEQDEEMLEKVKTSPEEIKLAQCYSGCLSETVKYLKSKNIPVVYTCAAHDKTISEEEHKKLGLEYSYPHLTNPDLWCRYNSGYMLADVIIVPSYHSERVIRSYGYKGRVEIIPHGCYLPKEPPNPLPERFTVGYLGAYGPDKGVRYLLEAWRKLNLKDSTLVLAGALSKNPDLTKFVKQFEVNHVEQLGWVKTIKDFYDGISCYVQPSCSEGFGLEVLEAMAHGRSVICSSGAGASDLVPLTFTYDYQDIKELCEKILAVKDMVKRTKNISLSSIWKDFARDYTWDNVGEKYKAVWRSLL